MVRFVGLESHDESSSWGLIYTPSTNVFVMESITEHQSDNVICSFLISLLIERGRIEFFLLKEFNEIFA